MDFGWLIAGLAFFAACVGLVQLFHGLRVED